MGVGATGGQGAGMVMETGSTYEITERRLTEEERNIIKDVEWGLHG
jgi:hypothetical protein